MEHQTTVIELVIEPTDLFSIVEEWVQKTKFSIYEKTGTRTIYTRNIGAVKAWLSIETQGNNAKIEAWASPKGAGLNFVGSFSKGYKVPVYNGQSLGPVAVYRKQFNQLMNLLRAKSKEPAGSEVLPPADNHSSGVNKSGYVTGMAGLGVISFVSGLINLFSTRVLLGSFRSDILDRISVNSAIEVLFGVAVFISSRLLAKGKLMAIWLYGTAILLDSAYNLAMGQKLNYLLIGFGLLMIGQMFRFKDEWELT